MSILEVPVVALPHRINYYPADISTRKTNRPYSRYPLSLHALKDRTDGMNSEVKWFLRGKTSDLPMQEAEIAVELFIRNNRKGRTVHLEDG